MAKTSTLFYLPALLALAISTGANPLATPSDPDLSLDPTIPSIPVQETPFSNPVAQSEVYLIGFQVTCTRHYRGFDVQVRCDLDWRIFTDKEANTIHPCSPELIAIPLNYTSAVGTTLDNEKPSFPKVFYGFGSKLGHNCTYEKAAESARGVLSCGGNAVSCVNPDGDELDSTCSRPGHWHGVDKCFFAYP